MIQSGKTYQTRSGKLVIIYAIYPDNNKIHGAINANGELIQECWSIDGRYRLDYHSDPNDLIEFDLRLKLKVNDPVYVKKGDTFIPAHFSRIDWVRIGKGINVFEGGRTSFTASYDEYFENWNPKE